ncbi:Hsp20/alpha crystallin family protein [Kordiimonas lipolytica]|uniref:Hsp20/alpha crystallin family protein n=1 Tax=Kordiimonas lipolytica TaxID=1662421 RepID=A0ABV8U853_9PROT|nr:Hsp20/alpha crystallin family protein [Kordiimonas lipolytica]
MATSKNLTPSGNGGRRLSFWNNDPFESLHDDMDRLFSRYLTPSLLHRPSALLGSDMSAQNYAQMDVRESDEAIDIKVDVPGMDVDDINVTLTDKTLLTIRGERKTESEEKLKDFYRVERAYGSFLRRIDLPAEVDENKIDASVKRGVLSLHLPKTAQAKAHEKKIKIKAS